MGHMERDICNRVEGDRNECAHRSGRGYPPNTTVNVFTEFYKRRAFRFHGELDTEN